MAEGQPTFRHVFLENQGSSPVGRMRSFANLEFLRETRRFEGVARLEKADCIAGRRFADAIVSNACFAIDIHNPTGGGQAAGHDEHRVGTAERVQPYDIPYGVLVPRRMDGLLFAGRCVSASHEALASCRVMYIAMALEAGAGAAAAFAAKHGCELRNVSVEIAALPGRAEDVPDRFEVPHPVFGIGFEHAAFGPLVPAVDIERGDAKFDRPVAGSRKGGAEILRRAVREHSHVRITDRLPYLAADGAGRRGPADRDIGEIGAFELLDHPLPMPEYDSIASKYGASFRLPTAKW